MLGASRDFGTAGTKESAVGAALDPGYAFRDGVLATERAATRVRAFDVAGTRRPAFGGPDALVDGCAAAGLGILRA